MRNPCLKLFKICVLAEKAVASRSRNRRPGKKRNLASTELQISEIAERMGCSKSVIAAINRKYAQSECTEAGETVGNWRREFLRPRRNSRLYMSERMGQHLSISRLRELSIVAAVTIPYESQHLRNCYQ